MQVSVHAVSAGAAGGRRFWGAHGVQRSAHQPSALCPPARQAACPALPSRPPTPCLPTHPLQRNVHQRDEEGGQDQGKCKNVGGSQQADRHRVRHARVQQRQVGVACSR